MGTKTKEDVATANIKSQVNLVRIITKLPNVKKEIPKEFNFDLLMHSLVCVTMRAIRKNDTTKIKEILGWSDSMESDFKKVIQSIRTDLLFKHIPNNVK